MKRILIASAFILFAVLMIAFAVWKTNQQWQIAIQCRCGNSDALFSKSDEFFSSHILGNIVEMLALVGAVVLVVNFPPLGYLVGGALSAYLLYQVFTNLNAADAYVQLVRNTALVEAIIVLIPLFFVAGKNVIYYGH